MESKWIHCPACGHRLFRLIQGRFDIEIKCPSCKRILPVNQDTKGGDRYVRTQRTMQGLPVQNNRMPR